MAPFVRVGRQVQVLPTVSMPLGHLVYLPAGDRLDPVTNAPQRRWPLLLFLHGACERGNNLASVARHGPPRLVEQNRVLPFIIISPQCPTGSYWDPGVLARLLDQAQATWPVDLDRVYITGMSMGGYGAWMVLARHPHRFAAAAIVCGGGNPMDARRLKHLPIWLFHGEQDDVVPASESLTIARALESAGGNVRLTLYPDADHDAWTRTYDNPELYDWFLSHRRRMDETTRTD